LEFEWLWLTVLEFEKTRATKNEIHYFSFLQMARTKQTARPMPNRPPPNQNNPPPVIPWTSGMQTTSSNVPPPPLDPDLQFLIDAFNPGGDYLGVDIGNTPDLITQVPSAVGACPFGSSQIYLDVEESAEPNSVNEVPVYVVAVDIDQDENSIVGEEGVTTWAFAAAYEFILNRLHRARDVNDYAQIRLLRPELADGFWDIVSDLVPYYDTVNDFLQALERALQSERNRGTLLGYIDHTWRFRITFVLVNNDRNPDQPALTTENIVSVTKISRQAASNNVQKKTNPKQTSLRWLTKTNPSALPPKKVRKKRGTKTQTQTSTMGPSIEPVTPKVLNKKKRTRAPLTQDKRDLYNANRRLKRAKQIGEVRGIYDELKRKIFHHSSLDQFYKHSKAILEVPNTWEEGYCLAMAFMKSECRIYSKEGDVYETQPFATQPERGRYAQCPILPQFSHLIDQDCDFITGDHLILFNPYKYPSEEPDPFIKYALRPPENIIRLWYQAAQNLHAFVCQQWEMDLDPNSELTLSAYADVFGVHLATYNIETHLKRSMILAPNNQEDVRDQEEFRVVSVLISKQHCSAITNLRAFLCNHMSANRSGIHNYCVFCEKLWTANNQTAIEAKTHFMDCREKRNGLLSKDTFERDRQLLVKNIHPEQFVYNRKYNMHICKLCGAKMEQGLGLGQLHHVCYMKKESKGKMGEAKNVFVYDFECEQKRKEGTSTFIHSVNLVCLRRVYPDVNGEVERHLFHTLEEFMQYIMQNNHEERVYLAHNGSKYDVQFIVRFMEKNMIPFDFIPAPSSMHAYLRVAIRFGANASATFLDFRHFMPGSLKNIAISFDLPIQKGDFPHHFNNGFNEHYVGRIPLLDHPDDYWCLISKKSKEEVEEFKEWYAQQEQVYCTCQWACRCEKKKWSFQEEIIKYCWLDVDVLAEAAKRYRDWLVTLGDGEDAIEGWMARPLDPYQYLTIPQLAMTILMNGLPEEENVTITPYKIRHDRVPLAIAWMERIQEQYEHKIRHVGNWHREFFEPKTKRYIDGITDDLHVFVCLNCQFHGCPTCYYEEFHIGTDHPKRPGTYGRIATDTQKFLQTLFATYSLDKTHVIWEHELRQIPFTEYERELGNVIVDREMFKGGRTEVFSPYCNADLHPDDTIQYHDVCSLYPFVCAFTELPVGHPEHYMNRDIVRERLLIDNEDAYRGYVRCKVVPKQDDLLGLLPCHDVATGRLEFPLKPMIGTWGTEEIRLAVQQGYQVQEIYEVYHWPASERSNTFMRGYVSYFLRMKQEAEGWKKLGASSETPDEEEQLRIVEKVYRENGYISKVRPAMVRKNATNRAFAKTFLNSLWGKFCQRAHTDQYETLHGYFEFSKLWNDPHVDRTSMQFRYLSSGTWKVKFNTLDEFATPNARYNIFVAAKVTESARCVLHKQMIRIGPSRILYCDTDSIMALHPKNGECLTGHGLGKWVDEYPRNRIKKLYALAPKFYYLEFDDDELLKSKGIMMNWTNKEMLTGYTLGKQLLELFYPRYNAQDQKVPFQGHIPMRNILIGINAISPNFEYGTMLTRETQDKLLQPVLSKRDLVPYCQRRNVRYDDRNELDRIKRMYTIPKGYYRSIENMSYEFYN
jgi:hypothetical protein